MTLYAPPPQKASSQVREPTCLCACVCAYVCSCVCLGMHTHAQEGERENRPVLWVLLLWTGTHSSKHGEHLLAQPIGGE